MSQVQGLAINGSLDDPEEVVLSPLWSGDQAVKIVRIARVARSALDKGSVYHVAGGPYKGISISKAKNEPPSKSTPHAVRKFLVHVQDVKDKNAREMREKRIVSMWFKPDTKEPDVEASSLFVSLTAKENFPKDYVSFIKKLVILVKACENLQSLELSMTRLSAVADTDGESPLSPGYQYIYSRPFFKQHAIDRTSVNSEGDDSVFPESPGVRDSLRSVDRREEVMRADRDRESGLTLPKSANARIWSTFSDEFSMDQDEVPDSPLTPEVETILKQEDPLRKTQEDLVNERDPESRSESLESPGGSVDERLVEPGSLLRKTPQRTTERQDKQTTPTDSASSSDTLRLSDSDVIYYKQQILIYLEDAFPRALKTEEISSLVGQDVSAPQVAILLSSFQDKGLAQRLDNGRWIRVSTSKRKRKPSQESGGQGSRTSYMRVSVSSQNDFQLVPQMPTLADKDQPSIAIITLLYCEKQAVDAMMRNRITYVRYKTEGSGDNQVYTLGTIGRHRVVSTKLSRLGAEQTATVSAGNTVTRLLGTFNKIQHVFMVGVGGSVPDYDNDTKHVRCGDVVIARPESTGSPLYVHVTEVSSEHDNGDVSFGTRCWDSCEDAVGQTIHAMAQGYGPHSMTNSLLAQEIQTGLGDLDGQELSFSRPSPDTDTLYRIDSDGAWGQVPHPEPRPMSARRMYPNKPLLHFGAVGAGYDLLVRGKHDWRHEFASFNDVKVLDTGFQAVMESIEGNRKDSFWIVRGVADYTDGMAGTVWQPYAALVAAAATKIILTRLPGGI